MISLLSAYPLLAKYVSAMGAADFRRFCVNSIDASLAQIIAPELKPYIEELRADQSVRPNWAEALRLSQALDEQYFDIQERGGDESDWMTKFRQARLAYAVSLCLKGEYASKAERIIYELAHASGEPEKFLQRMNEGAENPP